MATITWDRVAEAFDATLDTIKLLPVGGDYHIGQSPSGVGVWADGVLCRESRYLGDAWSESEVWAIIQNDIAAKESN